MMRSSIVVLVGSLLLVGCGAAQPDPGSSPQAGHLTLVAEPSRPAPGGLVHATITVAGPADYEAGCVQTVRLWVVDSQGQRVWTEPAPEVSCMAIVNKHVAAGETATFSVDWLTAASLAPGRYWIHGLFMFTLRPGAATRVLENLPPAGVTLQ